MDQTRVPVLIVGAGAAGLSCSALLAQQGISSLLVEKRRERFVYPKARNLSFRTLEILRRLGLAEQVHQIADGVSDVVVKPSLSSAEESPSIDIDAVFAGLGDLSPERAVQYCPQSLLEPILLAETRRLGSEVRYGTELVSWEQDDAGVTALIRDCGSGTTETVRAEYLVAADGTRSPVRTALGVGTAGHGALPIFVVFIYFRAPWRKYLSHLNDGDAVQVVNPDVNGILIGAEEDLGMFITTYLPSEGESIDQFTDERCRQLLTAVVGEPIELEIVETTAWQPHELVADEFQCGRVFLVGDAAHTMPPLKAGGANCAIQSAANLAWKLSAVLRGEAGPTLLNTYHTERHIVGAFSARQSLTGPTRGILRDDGGAPELAPEEQVSMFALLVGYQYYSAATVPGENESTPPMRLVEALQGQVGTRLPHLWVQRDGVRVSTLDLLGPSFTLVSVGERDAWVAAAEKVSQALGVHIEVAALDSEWSAVTGLRPGGALLVRPDEFIAWRTEDLPTDAEHQLEQTLSRVLAR